jgi:Protein of unknown function (DUF2953).
MAPFLVATFKIAFYLFCGIITVFALLLILPAWVNISYENLIVIVKIQIFFAIKIRVYPPTKWQSKLLTRKRKTNDESKKAGSKESSKEDEETKADVSIDTILEILQVAQETIYKTTETLTIKDIELVYMVHGNDAASTAIKYGSVNVLFSSIYAILENLFKEVKVSKIDFIPDFTGENGEQLYFFCKIGATPLSVIKIAVFIISQLKERNIYKSKKQVNKSTTQN